jgi:hypothetical protein
MPQMSAQLRYVVQRLAAIDAGKSSVKLEPPEDQSDEQASIEALTMQANALMNFQATGASPLNEHFPDEEEGEDPGPPGAPVFNVSHTTGAVELLAWPTIKEQVIDLIKTAKKGRRYVLRDEQRRGNIRLYGRGEGLDQVPGFDADPTQDTTGEGYLESEAVSDTSSPGFEGNNGCIGGFTPPAELLVVQDVQTDHIGGLSADGRSHNLDPVTVERLCQSYMEYMNNIHPLFTPNAITRLRKHFMKSVPPTPKHTVAQSTSASFIGVMAPSPPLSNLKRKSPGGFPVSADSKSGSWKPERNMTTALMFLIMALGKICEHGGPLPDVVREVSMSKTGEYTIKPRHPRSPLMSDSSPPSSTPSSAHPSPQEPDRAQIPNRRMSTDGARGMVMARPPKNMDVIPGLAYFATAMDILGSQWGGNSLQHVYAHILACLYYGQLGRVYQSHASIFEASRALQVIMRT